MVIRYPASVKHMITDNLCSLVASCTVCICWIHCFLTIPTRPYLRTSLLTLLLCWREQTYMRWLFVYARSTTSGLLVWLLLCNAMEGELQVGDSLHNFRRQKLLYNILTTDILLRIIEKIHELWLRPWSRSSSFTVLWSGIGYMCVKGGNKFHSKGFN